MGIRGGVAIIDISACLRPTVSTKLGKLGDHVPVSSLRFFSFFRYPSMSKLTWWKSGRTKSAARPKSGSRGVDELAAAMIFGICCHRGRYVLMRCI